MSFVPHSDDDIDSMLQTIGIKNIDDLFKSIPKDYRSKDAFFLKDCGLSEYSVKDKVKKLSESNKIYSSSKSFIGAGTYSHYIPAALDHIVSRSEFYTAYTPYQAEISQGTLQSIFEFQTYICKLTGMDVCNASMYDGATALAEAVMVAYRQTKSKNNIVLLPENIHPEYFEIVKKFIEPFGLKITTVFCDKNGMIDIDDLKTYKENILTIVVQSPNYYGLLEKNALQISEYAKSILAVPIFLNIESSSLALLKTPAELGFDLTVLELQPLGSPTAFGGPHIGVIACKNDYVRNLPGRIIGETIDALGNRCYVLTLATREQHIRREKATSNICSNQALMALRTAVYISLLGKKGLIKLAESNYALSHYAYQLIKNIKDISLKYGEDFYNEFIIDFKTTSQRDRVVSSLKAKGFLPGKIYKEKSLIVCVTELNNKTSIDEYVSSIKELLN